MSDTSIQWTDDTRNPTIGCERKSRGCDNCYAFQLHDQRYAAWHGKNGQPGTWPTAPQQYHVPFSHIQLFPERMDKVLGWRKPKRVFINSMSDLFLGEDDDKQSVPLEVIDHMWSVMAHPKAQKHTFQILSKRPQRMRDVVNNVLVPKYGVLPNVQLGHSIEDQSAARLRLDYLLETKAAVRFISGEPLLEDVDLSPWLVYEGQYEKAEWYFARYGTSQPISWVIIGGESGHRARPMELDWAASLVEQCRAAGVAPFVKQLGTVWARREKARNAQGKPDTHGASMHNWPAHLRVRQFPEARPARKEQSA